MPEDLNDVFVDVALACYERVRKLQPGSEEAEAAERALSMAVRNERPEKDRDQLLGDLLANGRFVTRRSAARRFRAVEECRRLAAQGISTGGASGFVEAETPETICMADDLIDQLGQKASRCGRHGAPVLRGLLEERTNAEISAASGVSPTTVNRTVRKLRSAAEASGLRCAA